LAGWVRGLTYGYALVNKSIILYFLYLSKKFISLLHLQTTINRKMEKNRDDMTLTDLICWVDRFAATKAVIINVVGSAEHVFSLPQQLQYTWYTGVTLT
jgi:hypothetical protein